MRSEPAQADDWGPATGRREFSPQARTGRAYRSVALSTKHLVVVLRTSYVYEPLRAAYEVLGPLYEVLSAKSLVAA